MGVEALNINVMGSKAHLGKGDIKLNTVITKLEGDIPIKVELNHVKGNKSTQKGFVQFLVNMREEMSKPPEELIPIENPVKPVEPSKHPNEKKSDNVPAQIDAKPSSKHVLGISDKEKKLNVVITSIVVEDLLDSGGALDKQDPSVEFTLGKKSYRTERLVYLLLIHIFGSNCVNYLVEQRMLALKRSLLKVSTMKSESKILIMTSR
jgi:hypothetical protein